MRQSQSIFSATDFSHWTEMIAQLATRVSDAYRDETANREILLAGSASPEWVAHVEVLGWIVHHDLRSEYLPRIPWGYQPQQR